MRSHHAGGYGQTVRLTEEQQERLATEVATGRFRNALGIRAWGAETFGAAYTAAGMDSLLEWVRCKPKVPRPLHEKANLADQEAWKKGDLQQHSRTPASP